MKAAPIVLAAALGACATSAPIPGSVAGSHEFVGPLPAGQAVICMPPDGSDMAWTEVYDRAEGGKCAAPAKFVILPICADGQPWPDTSDPAVIAARARLGRDGSLYGDSAGGVAFCLPLPPH